MTYSAVAWGHSELNRSMKKKELKLLALKSFIRGNLNPKRTKQISKNMTRRQLREYIRYLRHYEAKNKVTIEVADLKKVDKSTLSKITKVYPGKKIELLEDPNLILGLRVTYNDLIYDYNLKNNLEIIVEQI